MSLRYKALIAVVAIVAVLTVVLVVSSGERFEQDARERVSQDLRKDVSFLNTQLGSVALQSRTALEGAAESSEFVNLFRAAELTALGENMFVFTKDWIDDTNADHAFAVIDSFVAEDKKADVIAPLGESLAVVAHTSKPGVDASRRDLILRDPELLSFCTGFYAPTLDAGAGEIKEFSKAAVLPVADSVYLVVQSFLFESIQDRAVIGLSLVLTEVSSDWILDKLPSAGRENNPVHKIVFTGERLTAHTMDDSAKAAQVFAAAMRNSQTQQGTPHEFELVIEGETFLAMSRSSDLSAPGLINRPGFVTTKSLDRELAPFHDARRGLFVYSGVVAALAALAAYFAAYIVIRKLRRIELATLEIREGRFDTRVEIRGSDEIAKLGKAVNDMTSGLKALGMYTHETLARSVLDNPRLLGQTSTREEGSIFFSDIKGFTSISEGLSAEALTAQLNEYFQALGVRLRESKGYVDKFIGDAIMAFWGPPFVKEGDFASRACSTALLCLQACAELREKWRAENRPLFYQRIGIATGEVVVGNIGTENKKNFTVIGDSVNLASRLEGANKLYGSEILVDQRTALLAKDVVFREIDQIVVVGKSEPVRIFEPLGMRGENVEANPPKRALYEQALRAYRGRYFAEAARIAATLGPEDGPACWLRDVCNELVANPPADGWQPVTTAISK